MKTVTHKERYATYKSKIRIFLKMWEKKEMDGQYVRRSIDRLLV
jgi:hypothetical protein